MLLAVDTSTTQFSMALMDMDGSVSAEYAASGGKNRFVHLMPTLRFLLETTQADLGDVRCLAAALGPGSFTGLRVGLSMAKGLCHALGVPLIGVPSLMALACLAAPSAIPIAPLLDSRRGEFFTALFHTGEDGLPRQSLPDRSIKAEGLAEFLKGPVLLIGNDFQRQAGLALKALGPNALAAPPQRWGARASGVGTLALKRFHAGDFDDLRLLSPVYLRPPDIRPPAGTNAAGSSHPVIQAEGR